MERTKILILIGILTVLKPLWIISNQYWNILKPIPTANSDPFEQQSSCAHYLQKCYDKTHSNETHWLKFVLELPSTQHLKTAANCNHEFTKLTSLTTISNDKILIHDWQLSSRKMHHQFHKMHLWIGRSRTAPTANSITHNCIDYTELQLVIGLYNNVVMYFFRYRWVVLSTIIPPCHQHKNSLINMSSNNLRTQCL